MSCYTLEILELQKYFNSIINPSGKHFNEKIMRRFPGIYSSWVLDLNKNEFVYNLIHGSKLHLCKFCNTPTTLKSFKEGYRVFCSNKCVNKYNSSDKSFSDKISKSMKLKFNENYYVDKYSFVTSKDGENFTIDNYCEHGKFIINKNRFNRIIEKDGEICEECVKNYISKDEHITDNFISEKSFKLYHPSLWIKLQENCKEDNASFSEKKFMYKNSISLRSLCKICNSRKLNYVNSYTGYSSTCGNESCLKSSSEAEQDIFQFVKDIIPDAINRFKINNEEIDIFSPSLNIGIEYNGLYWHSEKYRSYKYHLDKMKKLRNLDIKMYAIWEDDWKEKKDIVVSQIKNLFSLSNKIYARKCSIKIVSSDEANNFLNKNHLQGTCVSSIRYGLYYEQNLVSLMTFGKKRMIFHEKEKNGYELLRFCNVLDYSVVGGASKLFKDFLKNYNPESVVSYANFDISDGNMYEKLGFIREETITPGFWWCKDGKKYHRSNFMKHKIALTDEDKKQSANEIMKEKGYFKVWNSGNLKYIWKNDYTGITDKVEN